LETRLRIPRNWQDFERLCHRLWSEIWADPNAQLNGRSGQPQAGVDTFGKPARKAFYAGVQCKDKDGRLGGKLSRAELDSECEKAIQFKPRLREFTVATTAPRDESVQLYARQLCESKLFPFDVYVWSWDEIEEEIRCWPNILRRYYPNLELAPGGVARVNMSLISHRDQCSAFFSRPEMQQQIPSGLREFLLPLCYEMSDNAYRHGKASRFSVTCDDTTVRFEDDGLPFDPLTGLDPNMVSAVSHVGSYVFDAFRREYGDRVKISYERLADQSSGLNRLSLEFSTPTRTFDSQPPEITVDMSLAVGRAGAEQLAASVPLNREASELVLVIGSVDNISALVEFLRCLLKRLERETRLIVYLPSYRLLRPLGAWLDDGRLTLRFR
jgi:hypothetical protein